jgi:hypothetical protein
MFVYGFAGPHDWMVVVLILAVIAGLVAWGVWRMVAALGRRFGLTRRMQFAVVGVLAAAVAAAVVLLRIDRLDALEKTCQSELLKHDRLSGSSGLEITKHVNFWDNHASGYWGISKPYEDPKVWLTFQYVKDGRKHRSFLWCRFAKIPDSGDPPKVRFDRLDGWWPDVLNEQNAWVPVERPRRP